MDHNAYHLNIFYKCIGHFSWQCTIINLPVTITHSEYYTTFAHCTATDICWYLFHQAQDQCLALTVTSHTCSQLLWSLWIIFITVLQITVMSSTDSILKTSLLINATSSWKRILSSRKLLLLLLLLLILLLLLLLLLLSTGICFQGYSRMAESLSPRKTISAMSIELYHKYIDFASQRLESDILAMQIT